MGRFVVFHDVSCTHHKRLTTNPETFLPVTNDKVFVDCFQTTTKDTGRWIDGATTIIMRE
jgi:hypothetical protein